MSNLLRVRLGAGDFFLAHAIHDMMAARLARERGFDEVDAFEAQWPGRSAAKL